MRVLQLVTGLGVGGAERVVLSLAGGLCAHGVACEVAALTDESGAVEVMDYSGPAPRVFDIRGRPPGGRLGAFQALRRQVARGGFDLIHAHMFHPLMAAVALKGLGATRAPIVFTSHNFAVTEAGRRILIRATRPWRALDILLGEGQHPRLNARRTQIIVNGVDVEPPTSRPAGEGLRLILVGRFDPQKDHLGLIRAFAQAAQADWSLTFAGAGPLEPAARALATELGVASQMRFAGVRNDVRGLLRSHDAFVMHSTHEGLPLAVLEAGAEGLPVLATPVGALAALLADERGYLAQPSEYVAALSRLAADPTGRIRRGERLRRHVAETYSTETMVAAHAAAYREVVKASSRNSG
jgi:glycosyltransferase involved in cell wall biosynthesis